MKISKHRLEYIDSIRGIAALCVIYFHLAHNFAKDGVEVGPAERAIFEVFSNAFDLGKIAVVLFFVVSGFVIPYSLFSSDEDPIRRFAISRFFRLYPTYWLSIPAGLLFFYILRDKPISGWQVVWNISMLQQFVGQENILGVYWTLQMELVFYFFCAVLFHFGLIRRPRQIAVTVLCFLAVTLVMAAVRFRLGVKLPLALPLALGCMFWGFSWRRYILAEAPDARHAFVSATLGMILLIPVICYLGYSQDFGHGEAPGRYIITYYSAMVLFVLLTTVLKLQGRIFVYLGGISYSVYLFGPVAQELSRYLCEYIRFGLNSHIEILIAMLFAVLIASVTYKWIEKPSIKLGRTVSSDYLKAR